MMMPDVNVLVAVSDPSHRFYHRAKAWLDANSPVATCAITELGMVRVLIQLGAPVQQAENHLTSLISKYRGLFVNCDVSVDALKGKITGHGQLTDKYLVQLCAKHALRLATFDKSIPAAYVIP
jgi:predicted nucleic acid-binding protein